MDRCGTGGGSRPVLLAGVLMLYGKRILPWLAIPALAYIAAECSVSLFTNAQLYDAEARLVNAIYHGVAGRPWQYRILVPLIEPYVPQMVIYVGLYALIFAGTWLYFSTLRIGHKAMACVLTFAVVMLAHTRSGMAHNTYLDVALFMFGMYAVRKWKYWWLVPLSIIGAFNREFILAMIASAAVIQFIHVRKHPWADRDEFMEDSRWRHGVALPLILSFILALGIIVSLWLRWPQTFANVDNHCNTAGWYALLANLEYTHIAKFLGGTLFLPVVALPFIWRWKWRWWGLALLAGNVLGAFAGGECFETRVMLYSLLAVCIPAVCGVDE